MLPCVHMERIGVRELRQHASEWLRRAQAGERVEVTNRGRVVAVLGPPPAGDVVARLEGSGRLKPASVPTPPPPPVRREGTSLSDSLASLRVDER